MCRTAVVLCMMLVAASCSEATSVRPIAFSQADSAAAAPLLVNRPALTETFTTPRIESLLVDSDNAYVERNKTEAAAVGFASGRLPTVSAATELYSEGSRESLSAQLTDGKFVEGWAAWWERSDATAEARLSALRFSTTAGAYRFAEAGADEPRPGQQVERVDDYDHARLATVELAGPGLRLPFRSVLTFRAETDVFSVIVDAKSFDQARDEALQIGERQVAHAVTVWHGAGPLYAIRDIDVHGQMIVIVTDTEMLFVDPTKEIVRRAPFDGLGLLRGDVAVTKHGLVIFEERADSVASEVILQPWGGWKGIGLGSAKFVGAVGDDTILSYLTDEFDELESIVIVSLLGGERRVLPVPVGGTTGTAIAGGEVIASFDGQLHRATATGEWEPFETGSVAFSVGPGFIAEECDQVSCSAEYHDETGAVAATYDRALGWTSYFREPRISPAGGYLAQLIPGPPMLIITPLTGSGDVIERPLPDVAAPDASVAWLTGRQEILVLEANGELILLNPANSAEGRFDLKLKDVLAIGVVDAADLG